MVKQLQNELKWYICKIIFLSRIHRRKVENLDEPGYISWLYVYFMVLIEF